MLKFILGGGKQENQKKTDVGGRDGEGISCGTVMEVDFMDLQALPEGCIANVVSLTTPRDAGRLSSVSTSFRSASESDAVWDRFLPPEIYTILSHSVPPHSQPVFYPSSPFPCFLTPFKSKKELYLCLCDNPILIEQGKMSFALDKWSGKKCYMISARELFICWGDTPHYWKWISVPDSRFEEVAELLSVCWLEIRGKIDTRMLSSSTLYKSYLVFKLTARAYGLEQFGQYPPVEVTVGMVGGEEPTKHTVYLDPQSGQNQGYPTGPGEAEYHPKQRDDGWLEIELGEFFCEGGDGGELEMACLETKGGHWKGGLIVQGIEIRPERKE